MLKIDGIPPRLAEQECEALFCQQYCYRGQLQQEVDLLLLKVNGRWHQLYFENGTLFWRTQQEAPKRVETQPGDLMTYPLIDMGEKYGFNHSIISDCITEPLPGGASLSFVFEGKGALIVMYRDNRTALRFIPVFTKERFVSGAPSASLRTKGFVES